MDSHIALSFPRLRRTSVWLLIALSLLTGGCASLPNARRGRSPEASTMKHRIRWLSAGTFALALFGCATPPPAPVSPDAGDYAYTKLYLRWMIEREMARHDVRGLSIALVDDQKVVWAEGFGYADATAKTPASPDTIYRIGSVTKLFTATAVMQLQERGRIDLDAPLSRYLPEFSMRNRFANAWPATVRALLSHHGGLPTNHDAGMWVDRPISIAALPDAIREEHLASPPQTLFRYSNLGYSLLGLLIERIEGREYATAMRDNLLAPLRMNDSGFRLTPAMAARYAKGYAGAQEVKPIGLRDAPAGDLYSSVNDMAQFMSWMLSDDASAAAILSRGERNEMWRPQFAGLPIDLGHRVGLGWQLSGMKVEGTDDTPVWHNGNMPPFVAQVALLPAEKLGVVMLSNTQEGIMAALNDIAAKALTLALAAKRGVTPPPERKPDESVPITLPATTLSRYAGHYAALGGELITIRASDARLETRAFEQDFRLIPTGTETFIPRASAFFGLISVPLPGISIKFERIDNLDLAVLRGLPMPMAFERIVPAPIRPSWQARIGRYRADQPNQSLYTIEDLELALESGVLVAKTTINSPVIGNSGTSAVVLRPISDSEAVLGGLGPGEGGAIRALDKEGVTELSYSGFRLVPKQPRVPGY